MGSASVRKAFKLDEEETVKQPVTAKKDIMSYFGEQEEKPYVPSYEIEKPSTTRDIDIMKYFGGEAEPKEEEPGLPAQQRGILGGVKSVIGAVSDAAQRTTEVISGREKDTILGIPVGYGLAKQEGESEEDYQKRFYAYQAKKMTPVPTTIAEEALGKIGEKTRPFIGGFRAPSVGSVMEMIDSKDIAGMTKLASEGLFPTPEELGEENIAKLQAYDIMPDGTQAEGPGVIDALLGPRASEVRRGEVFNMIPRAWGREHPIASGILRPMQWTAKTMFIEPYVLRPEQIPTEVVADFAGAILLPVVGGLAGKGAKIAASTVIRTASRGKLDVTDVGDMLATWLAKRKTTLTVKSWNDFMKEMADTGKIPQEMIDNLGNLTDYQIARVNHQLREFTKRTGKNLHEADKILLITPKIGRTGIKKITREGLEYSLRKNKIILPKKYGKPMDLYEPKEFDEFMTDFHGKAIETIPVKPHIPKPINPTSIVFDRPSLREMHNAFGDFQDDILENIKEFANTATADMPKRPSWMTTRRRQYADGFGAEDINAQKQLPKFDTQNLAKGDWNYTDVSGEYTNQGIVTREILTDSNGDVIAAIDMGVMPDGKKNLLSFSLDRTNKEVTPDLMDYLSTNIDADSILPTAMSTSDAELLQYYRLKKNIYKTTSQKEKDRAVRSLARSLKQDAENRIENEFRDFNSKVMSFGGVYPSGGLSKKPEFDEYIAQYLRRSKTAGGMSSDDIATRLGYKSEREFLEDARRISAQREKIKGMDWNDYAQEADKMLSKAPDGMFGETIGPENIPPRVLKDYGFDADPAIKYPPGDILNAIAQSTKDPKKIRAIDNLQRLYGSDGVIDALGTYAAKRADPDTPIKQWIKTEARNMSKIQKELGERGSFSWGKGTPQPQVSDPFVRDVLYASEEQRKSMNEVGGKVQHFFQHLKDYAFAEHEPELLRKGGKFIQFRDDYRTELMTAVKRGVEDAHLAINYNIFGNLSKADKRTFTNIVGLTSLLDDIDTGLQNIPKGLTRAQIETQLAQLENEVNASFPQIRQAIDKYWEFARLTGYDQVRRGNMESWDVKPWYFPHKIMDYMPPYWKKGPFIPRKFQEQFKPYTFERKGTTRNIIFEPDVLTYHYSLVFANNNIDDAVEKLMTKYDIYDTLTDAEKINLFGPSKKPSPSTSIGPSFEINGEPYKAYQAIPGRIKFPTTTAQGYDVIAMGQPHKTYLVPEPIFDKLMNFRTPHEYLPGISQLREYTMFWKKLALSPFGAGAKFHATNFIGDAESMARAVPGALNPRDATTAGKILASLSPGLNIQLTPFEERLKKLLTDKDVLGSGFVREFSERFAITKDPQTWINPMKWIDTTNKVASLREAYLRVMSASYNLHRADVGKQVIGHGMERIIADLDTESAIGHVARNFAVDYLAVPDWYSRWVRNLAFPFATFWQKNAANWAKYVYEEPVDATLRFLAPRAAIAYWNNYEGTLPVIGYVNNRYIEEHIPDWMKAKTHLNIAYKDTDGDKDKDTVIVLSPDMPSDMAMSFFGVNKLLERKTLIELGRMSIKEAAQETALDIVGKSKSDLILQLQSPLVKLFTELIANRNSFTKQPIVPDDAKGLPEWEKIKSYILPYFAGQLVPPINNMLLSAKENDPIWKELANRQNPLGALGYKSFDPRRQEQLDRMDITNSIRAKADTILSKIEAEFKYSNLSPSQFMQSQEYQDLKEEAKKQGVNLMPLVPRGGGLGVQSPVINLFKNPRVMIDKYRWMLERAKTKEEKQAINNSLDVWYRLDKKEKAQNVPRTVRDDVLEEIIKMSQQREQYNEGR